MPQNLVPLVNGQNYAWVDLVWVVFGVPLVGITSINWTADREAKMNYGSGPLPTSFAYGNETFSGSIDVYVDEIEILRNALPNRSLRYAPPHTATMMMGSNGTVPIVRKLKNIIYTRESFAAKQGDTGIIVTVPFIFAGLE